MQTAAYDPSRRRRRGGRQSKRKAQAAGRQQEAAVKLIVAGAAFIIAPWLLGQTIIGKALSSLGWVGLLMLAAGAGMMWLQRREARADMPALARTQPPRPATGPRPVAQAPRPSAQSLQRMADQLAESPATRDDARSSPQMSPRTWSKVVFDDIEWRRFEALVEELFRQAGFETKSQSHGADGGIDIWLYSRHQPGEPVSLVQCKHWQGKRVGVDKIRELRGVMAARNVRRGQFATTSTFTSDAESFARENGINLLDASGLLALIATRTAAQQQALLDVALQGDYWRPTCVNCGEKMVERTAKKGGNPFWGCAGYPRCKAVLAMRTI